MSKVLRPSDRVAIVGVIAPGAKTAATYTSDWVDMGSFERIMAIIGWGTLGNGAELDAKLEQATDSSGTGAKDITGRAITQVSEDVTPQPNNNQKIIQCRGDQLDVNNGFTHARLSVTIGTATSDAQGLVLGLDPRYAPGSDNDLSSVTEIV